MCCSVSSVTLSTDVRFLGDTLGAVLAAHGGQELFEHVESMRLAAKAARDGDADAAARLAAEVGAMAPEVALEVARAFTLYFQLVNQAEDVHRTRTLRQREIDGVCVPESLDAVFAELVERGATRAQILACLEDVRLGFVFTAHPTEARRRTTERLLSDVRRVLEDRDRRILTPTEERKALRELRASVEALWEAATERPERPPVLEEVKAGLWYLRHVLLDAVPRLSRRLHRAFASSFGQVEPTELPTVVRFGSWMGGDRDGNPFVTDGVMERTLEMHRWICVERYLRDVDELVDPLAANASRLPADPELEEALAGAAEAVPEIVPIVERRNPDEPLRRLLSFVRERLRRTGTFAAGAYARPDELVRDLTTIRRVLERAHAQALPNDRLLDFLQRVRTFGFVLAPLDVREDSRVVRAVVAELLGDPEYPTRAPAERRRALRRLRLPRSEEGLSAQAKRLLSLFDTVGRLHARFGRRAVPAFILSMTESEADVLEALRLAELYGLADHLDLVPLLETRPALRSARPILTALFADEGYREHLRRRDDRQELLVGYSDSMKEAGMLASRVGVLDAQRAATEACAEHGIVLRVFHGRGGSTSRGGGPTYRALRALPPEVFSGDAKLTEQGEVRAHHFANPDLAVRYLEQTVGAALLTRWEARFGELAPPCEPRALVEELERRSHRAYRELVDDPGLVPFFLRATPYETIAQLNIASRPAKRGGASFELSRLRAIPWVFAWSQCRAVITGWYGFGAATQPLLDEARDLYACSPFFRDLVDNVEMTLAKADLGIAERYAQLCDDAAVRGRIFGSIRREYERTRAAVLALTGAPRLLASDPVVGASIELRNPYVDPLSYLQVEALRRARTAKEEGVRQAWEAVARVTVQGIAAGLRNTG